MYFLCQQPLFMVCVLHNYFHFHTDSVMTCKIHTHTLISWHKQRIKYKLKFVWNSTQPLLFFHRCFIYRSKSTARLRNKRVFAAHLKTAESTTSPISDSTHLSLSLSLPPSVRPPAGRPEPWTSGGSWPSHSPMSSGCHSEWSWHGRYANPLSFKLSQEAGTQPCLSPQWTHTHLRQTH